MTRKPHLASWMALRPPPHAISAAAPESGLGMYGRSSARNASGAGIDLSADLYFASQADLIAKRISESDRDQNLALTILNCPTELVRSLRRAQVTR